jgi:hypothetical protein
MEDKQWLNSSKNGIENTIKNWKYNWETNKIENYQSGQHIFHSTQRNIHIITVAALNLRQRNHEI